MFLPLRDHNPTERVPIVTIVLIALNSLVFLYQQSLGTGAMEFLSHWGATPFELTHFEDLVGPIPGTRLIHAEGPALLPVTAFTSMFLHGGWMHLIFNMLFLWIFGNNVEDELGRGRFILFYLLWGLFGLALHVATASSSPIPVVGASGAISGVLGAYAVLYPRARVTCLLFLGFFIQLVKVPALLLITVWTVLQIFGAVAAGSGAGSSTAYWAHVGGLAAGWSMMRWGARDRLDATRMREHWLSRD